MDADIKPSHIASPAPSLDESTLPKRETGGLTPEQIKEITQRHREKYSKEEYDAIHARGTGRSLADILKEVENS